MNYLVEETNTIFHHAYMYAPTGIAIVSTDDGVWMQVNPAFCKMLGYEEQELLRTPYYQVTHPDDLKTDHHHILQTLLDGAPAFDFEKRYIHKDGRLVWASLHVSLVRDEQTGFIMQAIDVTGKKATEAAVSNRLISEHSMDFISRHSADEEATYLYASPASLSLLGYEPHEMVGTSAYEYFHPDDTHLVNEYLGANLRAKGVTYRIRRKDGRYVWFESTGRYTYDEQTGRAKEIIAISRDITERKRYMEQNRKAEL